MNQKSPTNAIITDAGICTKDRNHDFLRIAQNSIPADSNTANCPSSTPILNAKSKLMKFPSGRPKSASTDANPKPCRRPKLNTTKGLHLLGFVKKQFSMAIQVIDKAISGSTMLIGGLTMFIAASAKVIE
jgi:hypothetical protein